MLGGVVGGTLLVLCGRPAANILLLVLLAMFLTASTVQNIYIIVAGMVVIAAGELVRLLRLPKDITAHLTDTGLRER